MFEQMIPAFIAAVMMGLFELVKFCINKIKPEDSTLVLEIQDTNDKLDKLMIISLDSQQKIKVLDDMHDVRDSDGTPLVYVPRSWADTQKEILHTVDQVSSTQKVLAATMERCVNILDRIDRRQDGK
jgi:hypothetical protein